MNVKMGRVKKCEGCGLKVPSLGLPAEGKARWCTSCGKAQAEAVNITSKTPRKSQARGAGSAPAAREAAPKRQAVEPRTGPPRRRNESPPPR